MSFAWPYFLLLLLAPSALLAWELTHRRRMAKSARPKILRAEAGRRSLKMAPHEMAATTLNSRPRFWLFAGLALAVLALARPQWGRLEEPVFDQSREILLAIDLSRSMLTPDVKPSRLDRAKLLIQSLLEKLAGERVGLLVFSGTAFLQSPLSADYEILREFLPALNPEFLPQGGSNYGALIETALQAFSASSSADRFLVILSDGEATDEEWKTRAEELTKKGIRVIGLGVGTAGGGMIPDATGQFVKDERGAVVLSKLESATLQQLARDSGGTYRDASAWVDVAGLVSETIEKGKKGQFVEKNTVRLVERFQWPLAFGLWCLIVSFCYEFPVRPRPRDVRLSGPAGNRMERTEKTMTAMILLLLISALAVPTSGFAAVTPASPAASSTPPAAPPEPSALGKIVGRIAATESRTAQDWAELGRETVTWGSKLQSEQQPVAEGPVRDALAATALGSKLDAKAADWSKLREELEALLKKPEEEKKDQDQKQEDQENKDDQQQQNQDQKKQEQKSDQQKKDKSGNPQSSPQDKNDSSQKQDQSPKQDPSQADQKPPGESAFGDMNKKEEPPPPTQNTQKVGGAPERKDEPKDPTDPSLALPMQKLEQLRNQDSPAQLFQLMEGEKKATKKTGKDW